MPYPPRHLSLQDTIITRVRPPTRRLLLGLAIAWFCAAPAGAAETHESPYAGEHVRPIKSLSPDDLAELGRGGGWGLAKAAELNGMPGPAHLLEMKDEVPLSADQVTAVAAIFERMRAAAIAGGQRLVAAERALETAFVGRTVNEQSLRTLLSEIGRARTALRYTHLAAHLETLPLLTESQVARYNELRGYADHPCANPPKGHDPGMWRKHNGCE
ncbi:MAG: hypothetical protein OXI22_06090 [Defluviicoccus sp.]|nr:hypothetical protein [Defluviicoccus sp.]MDE0383436.1 hypothetical protein [Defluviicoccus sp.]